MKSLLTANPLGQRFNVILATAAVALAIPVLALALPTNAAANAGCGTQTNIRDGRLVSDAAIHGVTVLMRTGPSDVYCTAWDVLRQGDGAFYYCWTSGSDGRTWTFLRNARTGITGWVLDRQLRDQLGSFVPCGF
jgi:uncharacterized protein YraI